jgi:uncharacterized protein
MKARPNIGNFADETEALNALIERMVAVLDPQEIWLFGSRARANHRPDSDFDLLVVAKPGADWGDDYTKVYMAASGTGIGRDIVPCSAEDFEIAKTLPTTLAAQVLSHGRSVFSSKASSGFSRDRPARSGRGTNGADADSRTRSIPPPAGGGKAVAGGP